MQQPTNSHTSVSHFDFDRVDIQTESHTSTLKDLLGEIRSADAERNEDGQQIGISSLARTLAFLGQLTGRSYTNINEELPYSLLKTVKLLYLCSRDGENHIFEYLELPDPERNRPTFEFRLSGQAPRNETNMGIVLRLISELEKGIGDERRNQIRGVILTYSKLLDCIRIENDEILAPIRALPPELHANGTAAIARMAEHIESVTVIPTPATNPVNEALYTRILSLPFLHFVGEHQVLEDLARLDFQPQRDDLALRELCRSLDDPDAEPYLTPIISIAGYPDFFAKHVTALIKIVSTVTTLPIQKRDLASKIDHVQKVLHLHVFVAHGIEPLDTKLLTLADIVAAMCTVAHQQKAKTPYSPHWQGKDSKNSDKKHNVLAQLESSLSIEELYEEDYVPQGVNQLLLSRFKQFHAQMLGYQDRYHALRNFELVRLAAYAQCLRHTDINESVRAVAELNEYSARVARHWAHEASFA